MFFKKTFILQIFRVFNTVMYLFYIIYLVFIYFSFFFISPLPYFESPVGTNKVCYVYMSLYRAADILGNFC